MKIVIMLITLFGVNICMISCGNESEETAVYTPEEILNRTAQSGSVYLKIGGQVVIQQSSDGSFGIVGEASDNAGYTVTGGGATDQFPFGATMSMVFENMPNESGTYTLGELNGIINFMGASLSGVSTLSLDGTSSDSPNADVPVNIEFQPNGVKISFESPTSVSNAGSPSNGWIDVRV